MIDQAHEQVMAPLTRGSFVADTFVAGLTVAGLTAAGLTVTGRTVAGPIVTRLIVTRLIVAGSIITVCSVRGSFVSNFFIRRRKVRRQFPRVDVRTLAGNSRIHVSIDDLLELRTRGRDKHSGKVDQASSLTAQAQTPPGKSTVLRGFNSIRIENRSPDCCMNASLVRSAWWSIS
ncbi:MAG TPA: hypothetical protein VHV31_13970 [Nitrolancea sp.]|jgi:hypothetical protein|nr:hypothetical protein [Nitrolancea sp.]